MKKCPYCAEEIQDSAIVCKHCGRELKTGASQIEIVQKKRPGVFAYGCLSIIGICILFAIVGQCSKGSSPPVAEQKQPAPSPIPQNTSVPYEVILASLNKAWNVPSDHPSLAQFRSILESVEGKCRNSRKEISDITVFVQGKLKDKRPKKTILQVLKDLDSCIPESAARAKVDLKEMAAAYLVVMTQ